MEKHLLSKSTFIRSTQCLKSLYLHKRRPFLRDRLSDEQIAKFKRGTDVGLLAQQLFPGGADLQPKSPAKYRKSVSATAEQLKSIKDFSIYEASFQSDQILIILDILEKKNGKIFAYEVKSSKAISETYLKDAALQYYVILDSGIEIEDFFIIYINEDYVFDCENNKLDLTHFFKIESVLDKVKELQPYIKNHIPKAKEALFLEHSPEISIGKHCHNPYPCDFRRHCWKHLPKESIFDLPFLSETQKFNLHDKNILEIGEAEKIPDLSELDKIKLNCHLNKSIHFDADKIQVYLKPIKYPIHFISFSTVSFAVPRWKNTKPYESIPLQVSVTTLSAKQQTMESLFIVKPETDSPNEDISNMLSELIETNACIVVYDQKDILKSMKASSSPYQIFDFNDLIKDDAIYYPGIMKDSSPQKIGTKLLKLKKSPKLLSPLQIHQKLDQFLESTDDNELNLISNELNESGLMRNHLLNGFHTLLLNLAK